MKRSYQFTILLGILISSGSLRAQVVSANGSHTKVLCSAGTVNSWGENNYGQVGNGTVSSSGCYCSNIPVQVSSISGITAVSAGVWHALALKNDSSVWSWGANVVGELGDGTLTDRYTPVRINTLTGLLLSLLGENILWLYNVIVQYGHGVEILMVSWAMEL
jgi:hypothetical protein